MIVLRKKTSYIKNITQLINKKLSLVYIFAGVPNGRGEPIDMEFSKSTLFIKTGS
jgi:hypothetical protein